MKKLIPNSTQIPNDILDLLLPLLPEAEERCLLYICRRTFGFHKDEDRISFTQFINGIVSKDNKRLDVGTGLSRQSVSKALKNLTLSEAIFVRKNSKGNFYQINLEMDIDKVVKRVDQSIKLTRIGLASRPKQVKLLDLQKKGNKEKQSICETSSPIHILRVYFTEECKRLKGYEPEMSFAKEGYLLKQKLKRFSVEQLKDLIIKFLNSKVGEDLGFSLSICLSANVINQWQGKKLEKIKKPFFNGNPMVYNKLKRKWYVIDDGGEWLIFAGKQEDIIYK